MSESSESGESGEPGEVDPATYRLGTYLVIVAAVQFAAKLLGVGDGGIAVDILLLLAIWAALALRQGRAWGRTVFVVFGVLGLASVSFAFLAGTIGLALLWAPFVIVRLVAVAYSLPDRPVALDLPDGWRPWATSERMHKAVLVLGLLRTIQPGV